MSDYENDGFDNGSMSGVKQIGVAKSNANMSNKKPPTKQVSQYSEVQSHVSATISRVGEAEE